MGGAESLVGLAGYSTLAECRHLILWHRLYLLCFLEFVCVCRKRSRVQLYLYILVQYATSTSHFTFPRELAHLLDLTFMYGTSTVSVDYVGIRIVAYMQLCIQYSLDFVYG